MKSCLVEYFFLNYYSSDIMKTFIATFETLLAEPENQVNNEKKITKV